MSSNMNNILPNPIFEGSEKRFELHFSLGPKAPPGGLRALPRHTLDELMTLAACEIVSHTSNELLDSYVLSESSLFVYASSLVIKTCGTTRLLNCLERLLEVAAEINVLPERCKYSRASFLYPDLQPALYQNFDAEIAHIRAHLGHIGNGGSAFVLGDKLHGLQWHVYVLDVHSNGPRPQPLYNLEVCMTDLTDGARAQFYRTPDFVSSAHTTEATGIRKLAPGAVMDDYVFEPCGYSMNGIEGAGYITIHVTPEEAFSYASCELYGFPEDSFYPLDKAAAIAAIFQPGRMVVTFTVDAPDAACTWGASLALDGYGCASATCQVLANGSRVWFYSLVKDGFVACPRTASRPLVMSQWPSFATLEHSNEASSDGGDAGTGGSSGHFDIDVSLASLGPLAKRNRVFSPPPLSGSSGSEAGRDTLQPAYAAGDCGAVLTSFAAAPLASADTQAVLEFASQLIQRHDLCDTFFVVDLSLVRSLTTLWKAAMPRVVPLVPVRSTSDRGVLTMLGVCGAAFAIACDTDAELVHELALDLDCKRVLLSSARHPRDLRAIKTRGVGLVACASVGEVGKVARWHPDAQLVLTICDPAAGVALIEAATAAGLAVAGVAFDCGCAQSASELDGAVAAARSWFDAAVGLGHAPSVLHVGAGPAFKHDALTADGSLSFGDAPAALNRALDAHFPAAAFPHLCVFADPGPLLFEPASHMVSMVHGVHASGAGEVMYEVTDCPKAPVSARFFSDDLDPLPMRPGSPAPLMRTKVDAAHALVSVADTAVAHKAALPAMVEGDWLLYPFRGAGAIGAQRSGTFYVARPEELKAALH